MSATTTTPPLPTIIWDDQLEPHNPVDFADWPTKFRTSGDDDSMRYDPGQKRAAKFPLSAWQAKPDEDIVVSAFNKIIEYRCPEDHAISIGDSYTFHGLEKLVTTDNVGSGSKETYASACKRYTKGLEDAAAALGMDQPLSFHSSEVSELDSDRAAFRSMDDKVAGQKLLNRLLAIPLRADLFVNGSVYNREPLPSRLFRCVLFGEAKPPTGSMRTHIAYLIQALKYAVIGRDMHGTVHALLMVGMAFRRIVCDRFNNDIYVDIGTKAGGEMIEVEEMSLIKLLWYGYVEGAPPQMPTTTASAGLTSTSQAPVHATADAAKLKGIGLVKALSNAKTKPYSRPPPKAKKTRNPSPLADNLFYHLSKPDPPSSRPQSDTDARHALISFLDHMGQTHSDILRDVNETPESPLRGLTGRWAKVRDVKLEQLGLMAVTIKACWSDLPVGDTETASSQHLESTDAKDDYGCDSGNNDDDDNGPKGAGEGGDNGEEDAGPGGKGRLETTGPSSRGQGREDSSGDPRSSQDIIRGNQNRLASGIRVPSQFGPACPLQAIPEDSQLASAASLDAGDHPSDTSPTGSSSSGPRTLSSSTNLSLRTPQSLPVDGLPKIKTTSSSPEDQSSSQDGERCPSTGNVMFWDALGVSAFKEKLREKQEKEKEEFLERRRAWLEPYEPFTRARP